MELTPKFEQEGAGGKRDAAPCLGTGIPRQARRGRGAEESRSGSSGKIGVSFCYQRLRNQMKCRLRRGPIRLREAGMTTRDSFRLSIVARGDLIVTRRTFDLLSDGVELLFSGEYRS
ncbi:putative dNA-biding protein, H-NS-like protein [Burkholderia pseudomallei A79D]|nr:putative dNA-biding protein, H-NS-like protein [Burkholderia pseudomallei A79D]KGX96366.1 putative dNA-biding protein, H-NS-like protein [Burkholderia pseudomallei A79C]